MHSTQCVCVRMLDVVHKIASDKNVMNGCRKQQIEVFYELHQKYDKGARVLPVSEKSRSLSESEKSMRKVPGRRQSGLAMHGSRARGVRNKRKAGA